MKKGSFGAGAFGLRSLTSCLLLDHIYFIDESLLLFFAKSNRISFQSQERKKQHQVIPPKISTYSLSREIIVNTTKHITLDG